MRAATRTHKNTSRINTRWNTKFSKICTYDEITDIECSDSASRVPWNHLYLHAEVAKQVRAFRLKPSSWERKQRSAMSNVGVNEMRMSFFLFFYLCTYPSRVGSHCPHWSTWYGQRPKWAHSSLKMAHQWASLVLHPWPLRQPQGNNRVLPQKLWRKPWEERFWVWYRWEERGYRGSYRQRKKTSCRPFNCGVQIVLRGSFNGLGSVEE